MKQVGTYFATGFLITVAVVGWALSGLVVTSPLYFIDERLWYAGAAMFWIIGFGKFVLEGGLDDMPSREARAEAKRLRHERFVASYTEPGVINRLRREFRLW